MTVAAEVCDCVTEHRPTPMVYERHHILPLAWGGPDVPENVVTVCPTTHRGVHELLEWIVDHQTWPPRPVWSRYPRFVRELARQAVEQHGQIPQQDGACQRREAGCA